MFESQLVQESQVPLPPSAFQQLYEILCYLFSFVFNALQRVSGLGRVHEWRFSDVSAYVTFTIFKVSLR